MTRASPTPAAQIRALVRPLIDRNPELVLTSGKVLCMLPVGHVARQIRIVNRPSRGYFTLEWRLSELYVSGEKLDYPAFGRALGLIGRSRRFAPEGKGGCWDWDDPTMAGDFVDQVEAEIMPLFRSLDAFENLVEFILTHASSGYETRRNQIWMALTKIALGELAAAQKHRALISPSFEDRARKGLLHEDPEVREYYRRHIDIGRALMREDRHALAELLRANEKDEATVSKLSRHWVPSPFPLEKTC